MLTITDNAAEVIKNLVAASELPEGSGLRIAAAASQDGNVPVELSLAETPNEEEQVVEQSGAQVFLDQGAAPYLEGKLLDVESDEEQLNFTLSESSSEQE
jgi:Fe-S cluster assembly iron-binding protein IscA